MTQEEIVKLNIQLVEVNGCGMVLNITYDGKPIKTLTI